MSGRPRSVALVSIVALMVIAGGTAAWLSRRGRAPEAPPSSATSPPRTAARMAPGTAEEKAAGGIVEGRVVDPDGRPVPAAAVTALRQWKPSDSPGMMPAPLTPASARTGADGTFRLELPAAGSFVLGALAGGYTGAFRAGIEVGAGARVSGVELKLGKGGVVLSGRCLDAGGGAIPGGRLRASGWDGSPATPQAGTRFALEGTADAEGRYRMQLPPARYTLEAQADGYAPARDFAELTASETRDFRLEPAARIAGRVVTAEDRRPVAGAEVRAIVSERRFDLTSPSATTDDDGKFRLDGLPGGTFQVTARKDELVGTAAQPVTVAAGGHSEVELAVAAGPIVSGTVKSADGKPVAGAQVNASRRTSPLMSMGMDEVRTRSDASGRYRLSGLLPGDYSLFVSAEGRSPKMEELSIQASLTRDLVLETTAGVSGVVLTSGGQPAAGAKIEASVRPDGANRMGTSDRATADPQGHFTLTRLGPGKLAISARQGNEAARLEDLALDTSERKELTIKLQPGARVSGTVSWDDGSPAPDLKITGMQRGGGRDQSDTRSAADGSFTVGPFAAGEMSVVVMPPGERVSWSSMARPEQADLTLTAGEHRAGIKLTAPKRNGAIGGVVLAPDGQPVAGASLIASMEREGGRAYKNGPDLARSVTGPDGAFALESLKKGSYTVWASSPEHPEVERTGVSVGTRDLRLQLARAASVAGVFVGPDGKPVPSYTLVAVPPGKESDQARMMRTVDEGGAQSVNDARGAFHLARLTAGRYGLVASAPDGKAARLEVSISEGEKKQGLRLVAQGGVTVQGRVVEYESGQPLAGIEVRIRAGTVSLQATTDAQGAFEVANVPTIPGVMASVGSRERTHVGQGISIPPARDGRADVGTIKLVKADPKNPNKGRIGLNFNERDGKLVINSVLPDTPAARMGIKVGDVLVSVDGKSTTTDRAAATAALRPDDPGREIKLVVQTPGQEPRTVTVKRVM